MPDPISTAARRRRTRRRRLGAIGAGVVVIAAGGGAALAATGSSDSELITGTVTTGSVTQTVEASGTVSAPSTTSAAFAASGTVAEVGVAVGDTVTQGEVLAKLQTTDLENKLTSAKADVASAEQRLEDDETGQTSSVSSGSAGGSSAQYDSALTTDSAAEVKLTSVKTTTSGATTPSPSGSSTAGAQSGLKSAQQAVINAQQQVDNDQLAVDAAQSKLDADVQTNSTYRDAQQTQCAADAGSPTCATATATYEHFADTLGADSAVLKTAVTAQDAAIKDLDRAIATLDTALSRSSSTSPSSSTSQSGTPSSTAAARTGASGARSGSTGTSAGDPASQAAAGHGTAYQGTATAGARSAASNNTGESGVSSSEPASASQLAADQAQIDSARAQLRLAKQNLAAATLKSPISGTVAAVGLTVGKSSSGSITILGKGNQVVSIGVPLSQIDQVKTGQGASIQVDGQTAPLHGTVTKIGVVSSTSGSVTTFPVTVTLASGSRAVHDGVGADVTITTGTTTNAILVPNSAITTIGTRHTVTVVSGGNSQTVAVTLGLVGGDTSQVTAGLKAGEQVCLADPSQALPSSTTQSTTTRLGGFGGFGGAGFRRTGGG